MYRGLEYILEKSFLKIKFAIYIFKGFKNYWSNNSVSYNYLNKIIRNIKEYVQKNHIYVSEKFETTKITNNRSVKSHPA